MNNTQNKFTSFDDKVVKLEKDAYESLENATGTKDRAQDMLDSLKKFVKNFEGILLKIACEFFFWVNYMIECLPNISFS